MEMSNSKTMDENHINNEKDKDNKDEFSKIKNITKNEYIESKIEAKQADINDSYRNNNDKSPNQKINYININSRLENQHQNKNNQSYQIGSFEHPINKDVVQFIAKPFPNELIPIGPSYIKQSNNNVFMIIEHKQNRLDPQLTYIPFPMYAAIIAMVINIILPGIGTIIASCFMCSYQYKKSYFFKGLCELISASIVIGWFLSIYNGVIFITAAWKMLSVEEYYTQ